MTSSTIKEIQSTRSGKLQQNFNNKKPQEINQPCRAITITGIMPRRTRTTTKRMTTRTRNNDRKMNREIKSIFIDD